MSRGVGGPRGEGAGTAATAVKASADGGLTGGRTELEPDGERSLAVSTSRPTSIRGAASIDVMPCRGPRAIYSRQPEPQNGEKTAQLLLSFLDKPKIAALSPGNRINFGM